MFIARGRLLQGQEPGLKSLPKATGTPASIISRAGANAVCELIALRKPNLLIPLSAQASRGDQILNAASCRKQGFSMVLQEEEITDNALFAALSELYRERDHYAKVMAESPQGDAVAFIADLIEDTARKEKKK